MRVEMKLPTKPLDSEGWYSINCGAAFFWEAELLVSVAT